MASPTQWTWVSKFWEVEKDREAWRAAVHGAAKSQTRLSDWTTTKTFVRVNLWTFSCLTVCYVTIFECWSRWVCSSLCNLWVSVYVFACLCQWGTIYICFHKPVNVSVWKWSRLVVSDSLRPHGLYPTRLLHPWDFPGKVTGVGFHFLLQSIFLTQVSNPGLPASTN